MHSGHIRRATLNKRNSKSRNTSNKLSLWRRCYGRSHKCITSKAVLFILFWSFSVSLTNNCIFEGVNYFSEHYKWPVKFYPLLYVFKSLATIFYPLAGFLADTKYSWFKTITRSSQVLLLSIFIYKIFSAIIMTGVVLSGGINSLFILVLCPMGMVSIPTTVLIIASLVTFNANIIQFGVDQLQDSPADHQSLFIHWYIRAYYLGVLVAQVCWSSSNVFIQASYLSILLPIVLSIVLLLIVVLIVHYKKHWFIIDTARSNPYKLVYRVTKFARQYKVHIHRSAFTYCEDDIPSRLDLGKSKYGGPFTTEEVENVKAFYGILKFCLLWELHFLRM